MRFFSKNGKVMVEGADYADLSRLSKACCRPRTASGLAVSDDTGVLEFPMSDIRLVFRKSDFDSKRGIKHAFRAISEYFDKIRTNENLDSYIIRTDDQDHMYVDFWMSDHEAKDAIVEALRKKGETIAAKFRNL